jgi:hypothetical protein
MAKQPAYLITQATPTKTLKDMAVGEIGYTTANAYIVETDDKDKTTKYFIEDSFPVIPTKDGNIDVKVKRVQSGYELDFSESESIGVTV